MATEDIKSSLKNLPLGWVTYLPSVTSTNDIAARWIEEGCPDLSLVIADEQTAGRGRAGRTWHTEPGQSLAFSLVLRPPFFSPSIFLSHLTALGAFGVRGALLDLGLPSEIKWPNDVLVRRRKVAGVLAEAQWSGSEAAGVILGIGVNISPASTAEDVLPSTNLKFPASSIGGELGFPVDRFVILRSILDHLLNWRPMVGTSTFIAAWEEALAFRGELVTITGGDEIVMGEVLGLAPDGELRLRGKDGKELLVQFGDVSLINQ